MVAVVSGSGLGLFNSSTSLLGGDGADGNSQVGRGRDRIYVNSSTGNLIVQGVDDVLSAIGLDFAAVRTYNSQGLTDEDNNDNWRLGVHQRIHNLTGTVNTAGSTVTKVFGDGAEVVYTWNASRSRYESADGDGANDFLTWNAGNSRWTWTDGSARATEEYGLVNGVQRILMSRDADANTITYTYAGSLLTSIAMAGSTAQTVYFDYTDSGAAASNLRAIRVVSNGVTQTLTRYTYDSAQRLQTVTVDLTPANTSDNVTYVTTYTYDGSSRRIASITQSDGSSVAFTYQNINGDYRLSTVTDAENRVTTFTYSEVTGGGGTPVSLPANGSQISTTDTVDHPQVPGALTPSPAGWNAAGLREGGTAGAVDSRIAFDSNGNGILVWRASTNVWAQRYTRATNSWGPEVLLDSRSTATSLPAFSMDPGGNAVASWVQSDGTANSIWAARYTASTNTWTTAQLIDTVPTDLTLQANTATHTMVNVMNGTRAAIAFQIAQTAGGSVYDLYVARFDGTNWLAPVLVEAGSADAGHPSIAMDSQGNIGVAFRQSDGTADSVFVNRFTASTGTWSGAVQRDTIATATAQDPRIAFDANGNGLLIYRSGNNINAQRYTRATNSWSAQVTLDTRTNTTYSPSLALDANGTGFAAWIQSNGTAQSVYVARFDGTAWSTPTLLDTAPTDPTFPVNTATHTLQLRVNGNRAAAIWQHRQGTSGSVYDVFVARYDGTTWLAPEPVESRAENAAAPTLAIDGAGNISAAFQQSDGTAVSLYVSRYNVAAAPDFYVVPAGATWQSIAAAVYGIDSAAAGAALQAALAGQTLATGVQLGGFPPTLTLATTVAPYYRVIAGDTWSGIAQKVYGTTDANAIAAMQAYAGTVTFNVGDRLPMQQTLNFTAGGTGPAVYQRTVVRDALGIDTTYVKDAQGRITAVTTPVSETRYTYDPVTGNLATVTQDPTGLNRVTTFGYDAHGNLTSTRDSLGNTVTRTYNANNQLETETSYLVRDPDGAGSGQPSGPLVSRFVYDAVLNTRLRFTVSADGRVTEHVYDAAGQRTITYRYAANTYSGAYTESALNTWAAAQRANALERLDYAYDFRGNVSTLTQWAATTSAGAGTGAASVTRFVYDQRGLLLSTVEARGEATSSPTTDYVTNYTYDGLGRRMVTTTWVSGTETARQIESTTYDDANRRTVSTFAGGLTKTLSYNRAGDLTSVVLGPTTPATTTYTYDANGRLRVTTDPLGVRTYRFYDDGGRLIGTVDGDGSLTELTYNRAGQVVKTVRYATALGTGTRNSLAAGSWSSVAFSTLRTEANAAPDANRIARSVYDGAGQLVYEIDALGGLTRYEYDGAGRLAARTFLFNSQAIAAGVNELTPADITAAAHADDRRVRYLYNNDGLLTGTLDAAGFLRENVYDAAGRLVATIGYYNASDATRRVSGTLDQLRPGSSGSVAQLDPARDITTRIFHDAQGRKVGELDGERYLTEFVHDVAGNVLQAIRYDRQLTFTPGSSTFATLKSAANGAATHVTAFTYDGLGKVLTETNFQGTQTLYGYDVAGNLISTTRANNVSGEARTTRARYDVYGRVTQELGGEGSAALAALGGSPSQAQIDDIWNRWGITHTYDAAGRRTSTTVRPNDQQTNTTYFYYDNDGRLRFTLDPRGRVSENRYDALGQLVETIEYWRTVSINSPTGGLLTAELIPLLSATEAANVHERKTFGYSTRGELTSTATAGGATTALAYNIFGELRSSNAGSGFHAHEYTYDARGLQKLTRRNGVTFEDRTYDAFGRLTTVVDARGNTFSTTFDRLGRELTSIRPGDANARVIAYDGFSRVTEIRDKLLNVTRYAYNDATRTVTVTTPENVEIITVHNVHGEEASVTVRSAGAAAGTFNTVTYLYDKDGRLKSSSDNLGTLESRGYDRAGRQVSATDARGVITTFEYDAANRILFRRVDTGAGGLALVTSYAYDPQNRWVTVTEPGNSVTRTEYDRDGRVAATVVDPNGTTPSRTEYVYDTANNVIRVFEGAGSAKVRRTDYAYDVLGRRTDEYIDPNGLNLRTQYFYDNNNNVTRKIDARQYSTWYTYDAQNRLVQTIDALGGVTSLGYDAEDRVVVTRRHYNTIATGSLGNTPAIQSVNPHPWDRVTRSVYDRDGRERFTLQTSSATGSSGNVTSETAVVTERTFDANGNVTRTRIYRNAVTVPGTLAPSNVESALASAGNSLSTLHAADRVQWTAYDLRGQVVFTVDGAGAVVRYTVDAAGNVVAQIEYATSIALTNLMTAASLTAWADQSSVANHSRNRLTRTWYDSLGRVRFTLDAEGYLSETRYLDAARQEQGIVYHDEPTAIAAGATLADVETAAKALSSSPYNQLTTKTFDAAGRVLQVTDADNRSEYFVYDAVGNKIRYVNQKASGVTDAAYTWIYDYDANGRLITETSPAVAVTTITDNGASLTATTNNSLALVTRYAYDALGNVTSRTEADGTSQARTTNYEYDALGRQTATVSPTVGIYNAAVGDTEFGVGGAAVPRRETQDRVRSETAYDVFGNAYRHRIVTESAAANSANGAYTYKAYDNLGRVKYEVDAKNQLTAYTYDVFGNKTQVTRHATALSSSLSRTAAFVSMADVETRRTTSAADRTIDTDYDRLNRATSIRQPSAPHFIPNAGNAGGTPVTLRPTVEHVYDAFGQVVMSRELTASGTWGTSYFYYDRRGLKVAELDAARYLTRYFYDDSTGDLTSVIEYARPTTGTANVDTYGTIVTSGNGQAEGGDRRTDFGYDKLNRKTSETKVNLEYSSIGSGGALVTTLTGSQTTTFGYDALGNQTLVRVQDPATGANVDTYTYYDVLGRVIAIAEPQRDLGNGQVVIPLTRLLRDAHGNLVQKKEYHSGTGAIPSNGSVPNPTSENATLDRTTTLLVDARNNVLRTEDPTGADRLASYDARGNVEKEWQVVVNPHISSAASDDITDTIVTLYHYDEIGQQTQVVESQRYQAGSTVTATRIAEYNAFGEITAKYNQGDAVGAREYFHYDNLGRVWRTNSGDGVDKVYQYDLQGNATVELRSKSVDLGSSAYQSAADVVALGAASLMRTETVYDLHGNIVERRMPTFEISSGLPPVGTNLQISVIGGIAYVNWNGALTATVTEVFEYRAAGSSAAWQALNVQQISAGVIGVDVMSAPDALQEYRIRYLTGTTSAIIAESTGTFRVERGIDTNFTSISVTPQDTSLDVAEVSIQQSGPLNLVITGWQTEQWNGFSWQYDNVLHVDLRAFAGMGATAYVVYSDSNRNTGVVRQNTSEFLALSEQSDLTRLVWRADDNTNEWGGLLAPSQYPVSITVFTPDGTVLARTNAPAGPPMLIWNAPSDTSVTATFRYKTTGDSQYSAVQATRFGPQFRVDVTNLLTSNSNYDFEIEYVRAGEVVSRRGGVMNSTGVSTIRTITGAAIGDTALSGIFNENVAPPTVVGTQFVWAAPTQSVQATFEYSQGGNTYQGTIQQGADWRVNLASVARGVSHSYTITYRQGERVVARQTGTFSVTTVPSSTTTTIEHVPGSATPQVADVGTLSGQNTIAPVTGSPTSSMVWVDSYGQWAYGPNIAIVNWASVGNQPVKVELRYQRLNQMGVPQSTVTGYKAFTGEVRPTGGTFTWYEPDPRTGNFGGIYIQGQLNVIVWGQDAAGNYTVKLRETGAGGSGASPRLTWVAPTDPSGAALVPSFSYSGATSGTLSVQNSGGTHFVDVGHLNGTYSFTLTYTRSGESSPVITRSGGQFTANGGASTIVSQGSTSNANTQALSVGVAGSTLSWSRAASGNSVTFYYRLFGTSTWLTNRQPTTSDNQQYVLNLLGLTTGSYEYQVVYRTGSQPIAAFAQGRLNVTTTQSQQVDELSISGIANSVFPTQRITSISLPSTSDTVSWSYAKLNTSDVVTFQYYVGGTWHTASISGSSPSFSARMAALPIGASQSIPWVLTYTRAGETTPYARANGTASISIAGTHVNPVITVSSQGLRYPSNVQQLAAPQDLGSGWFGWSSLSPETNATVTFRMNGSTAELQANGAQRRIHYAGLGAGTYNYELTFTRSGESNPYARVRGSFTVTKNPGAVANTTFTVAPPRAESTFDIPPGFSTLDLVWPPQAVYWLYEYGQGGPRLEYGPRPYNQGGGYEMLIPPGSPGEPNGTWHRYDPPIYKFFAGQRTLTWARLGGNENTASVYYWSLSNPSDVKQMTVGAYDNIWAAYPTDQNGNLVNLADGNYGYRIEVSRTGSGMPWGVQTGTFSRSGGAYTTVTATPNTTPVVQAVMPTSYQKSDRWGNVLETRDASGNVTNYRYNGRDQLVQTLEATDRLFRYSPDAPATDVTGRAEKTNHYDALGRLIEVQDGYDQASRVSYNAAGQQVSRRNADHARYNATSTNVYDVFGNLLQSTDESNYRTRYKYDKAGRLTEVWREITAGAFTEASPSSTAGAIANLQVIYYRYDEAGRRISETNGIDSEITRYQYDHRGNVTARITPQQAANGLSTRYVYDINGNLVTETDALGSVKQWTYDSFRRVTTLTELTNTNGYIGTARAATISYTYNEAGQLSIQTRTRGQESYQTQYSYDAAGNLTSISDLGVNRQTIYRYDAAGRLARETVFVDGRRHQDTRIGYDAHNRITTLDDPDYRQVILYDANGNRSRISSSYIDHNNQVVSDTLSYAYDETDRVLASVHWTSKIQMNAITRFTYNGRGDRLRVVATDAPMWERRTLGGTVTHNVKSNLNTPVTEDYTYDGLGRLKTVTRDVEHVSWTANWQLISRSYVPTQIRSINYDKAGRIDTDTTVSFEGGASAVNRVTSHVYDLDGRASTSTTRRSGLLESVTTFGRSTLSGSTWSNGYDDAGNVRGYTVAYHNPSNGNHQYTATYRNTYELAAGYREAQQSVTRSDNPNQTNYFYRGYNFNGELSSTAASGDSSRNRYYTSNQSGQTLTVVNGNFAGLGLQQAWDAAIVRGNYGGDANWARAQHYFFANGNFVGTFGQLQTAGSFTANFDVNYTPISDSYPGSVPSSIVVQAGDTLRTIAQRVFGDASLWYVIAEENGLTNPDEDLPDGLQLRIPNEVVSLSNNSESFKPFNIADAMGDVTPNMPDPPAPKGGCGVIGMIIMIVVLVVVTIFTAGAAAAALGAAASGGGGLFATGLAAMSGTLVAGSAGLAAGFSLTGAAMLSAAAGAAVGSAVSQGVGIAIGAQEEFDWKQVGIAAVSAGITAGMGGAAAAAAKAAETGGKVTTLTRIGSALNNMGTVGRAAVGSALTQGVSVATGLQSSFNWKQVATAALAAPIKDVVGNTVGAAAAGPFGNDLGAFLGDFAGNVSVGYVNKAMGGRIKSEQILADAFGNALANSLTGQTPVADYSGMGFSDRVNSSLSGYWSRNFGVLSNVGQMLRNPSRADKALTKNPSDPMSLDGATAAEVKQLYGVRVLNDDGSISTEFLSAEELGYAGPMSIADMATVEAADDGPVIELEIVDLEEGWYDQYDEKLRRVDRNMQRIIAGEDHDFFALMAGTQKPGMMVKWVSENRDVFAREFAGPLNIDEMAFIGMLVPEDNVVSPLSLTNEQMVEARALYGSGADAGQSYANMRNRMAMVRYVGARAWGDAMLASWDFFLRDSNPLLFAYERGYRFTSGQDAWTGQPVSRLGAAMEFTAGLALAWGGQKLAGKLQESWRVHPPGSGLLTSTDRHVGGRINPHLKASGLQRHHLNESGAYGDVIPRAHGQVVPIEGWGSGTAHTEYHRAMKEFWRPYQPSGSRYGQLPTNAQVQQGQTGAFLNAGYTPAEAKYLAGVARAERLFYGLKDKHLVPAIPRVK